MLLSLQENGTIGIRSCSARAVVLTNGQTLQQSFLLSPDSGVHAWSALGVELLGEVELAPVIAAQPDVFLLGSGERQKFPSAAVMAACLSRRIGIEVMDNAAAARTFNVLSSEGRRVLLGILLTP